jgi:secretion/DNA translocation related TadE-like protein
VSDDGTASVLMIALLALAGFACLATADAANVLLARARAQSAADAAALAAAAAQWKLDGTDEPSAVAADVAESNGAALESCACDVRAVSATVVVSVGTRVKMLGSARRTVTASATAAFDPQRLFESR